MKKIALAMVVASGLFASNTMYNYEVTPTIGGVHAEGNLGIKDYSSVGLRVARNLEDMFLDQVELGFDYSFRATEQMKDVRKSGRVARYFLNAVKDIAGGDKFGLYGLLGVGYEDVPSAFTKSEDGGFGQYGLGLRYQLSDRFALKAEVRDAIKFEHADHNLLYTLGFAIGFGSKSQQAPAPAVVEVVKEKEVKVVILDDDNDGVLNDVDKCPNTPANVVVDENGCQKVIVLKDLDVNFAFDSYKVSAKYSAEIKKVADFMSNHPAYKVLLAGYTDSIGADAYNQTLSVKRADAVAKELEKYGVDSKKITTVGYGKNNPVASNATAEGRAQNRRVEATFSK